LFCSDRGNGSRHFIRKGSRDLDPDGVLAKLYRVATDARRRMAHAVPGPEVELPRMAGTGEDPVFYGAPVQGSAAVRADVLHGVEGPVGVEQGDLPTVDVEDLGVARGNVAYGGSANQRRHVGRLVVVLGLGPTPDNWRTDASAMPIE